MNPETNIGKLLQDEIHESIKRGERPDLNKVLVSAVVQLLELTQENHKILEDSHRYIAAIYGRVEFRSLTRKEYLREAIRERALDRLVRQQKKREKMNANGE
jgi:hypothetical protein